MTVTLRVSSNQSRALGADATRVFQAGGTIGRTQGNDWVLPDPDRFVSGQHAVISLEHGVYMLTDRSTNGTIVNGRELPKGGRVRLSSGDVLTIGNYEIAVTLDEASAVPSAPEPSPAAGCGGDYAANTIGGAASVDPLDFFSDPAPRPATQVPNAGAEPDHVPADAEFFAPPRVAREQAPAADPGFIPEDWDDTGFSSSAADSGPGFAPSAPQGIPADESSARDSNFRGAGLFGDSSGDTLGATRPPAPAAVAAQGMPGSRERVPGAGGGAPGGMASGGGNAPGASSSVGRAPAPTDAGPALDSGGVDTLLRAAGIDPAHVDAETLASLGEILHVVVDGLMEVLRARTALKNQFRVAMTTLKPVENNPLKFSASAEDALFNLFARRGQSYKAPVDAFREAFDDLKAHQIAMMAGMRAAFGSLLKRFDPDELQTAFDRGMKRAAILDVINKTKYWELYREMYEELGDDDGTFRRLFGDEFAQAYEEQMQRLTTLHKR